MFKRKPLSALTTKITDGSHFSPTPVELGRLIANVKDMQGGSINRDSCTKISERDYLKLVASGCVAKKHDVLLSKDGTVGKVAIVENEDLLATLSSIAIIRIEEQADHKYIGQFLKSEDAKRQYENAMSGSAVRRLVLRDINTLKIPTPQKVEQRLIARILDTLDTQIQQTEALIAKLEKVKEGLLHDLLTRGIDENGQLRPSPEQAPELYKESPLGLMPREWEVGPLGECLSQYGGFVQTGPFGSQLHADEYVSEGVPVVMPQDMRDIEVSKKNIAKISEIRASDLNRHRVAEGDLLFSRRGDLSRCSYISELNKGWLCGTGCLLLRPTDRMNGYWLANIYKRPSIQSQVYGMAVGSTMVNLNSSILRNIVIPTPTLREQSIVADAIRAFKRQVIDEKKSLNKMRLKKSGLMDDLLTGRVRVTPLLDQAQTPA